MAEFCNSCAHELGMKRGDSRPLLCEHCGKYKKTFIQKIVEFLKK